MNKTRWNEAQVMQTNQESNKKKNFIWSVKHFFISFKVLFFSKTAIFIIKLHKTKLITHPCIAESCSFDFIFTIRSSFHPFNSIKNYNLLFDFQFGHLCCKQLVVLIIIKKKVLKRYTKRAWTCEKFNVKNQNCTINCYHAWPERMWGR